MFKKIGEAIELGSNAIQDSNSIIPTIDPKIFDSMQKFAANLKRVAPKAEDFLYFAAVMMHAAEAALINDDGTPKLTRSGEKVEAHWDKTGGTWKWVCNDSSIKPVKNSNGDIFPESELLIAHKKWIERPLCIDHKSNSVDHIRGLIVDTYYDHNLKRVIALCALDKKNYPDLAQKVSSGLSNSVSMGTGVGRAICYDCGQVAKTEQDFCYHMRTKSSYGEINVDLSPIELSIVVNGADPKAKIKHIIAAANAMAEYVSQKDLELKKLGGTANSDSIAQIRKDLNEAMDKLAALEASLKEDTKDTNDVAYPQTNSSIAMEETETGATDFSLAPPQQRFASDNDTATKLALLKEAIQRQLNEVNNMSKELNKLAKNMKTQEEQMSGKDDLNKKGYFQGGGDLNEPTPGQAKYPKDPMNEDLREHGDKHMAGQTPFPDVGSLEGMHPSPASTDTKDELERKKMLARADAEERALRRASSLQKVKDKLEAAKKEAYFLGGGGVNEPAPHKVKYPIDKMNEKLREDGDKQMEGQKPFPDVGPVDGLHPSPMSADQKDELKRKELLRRAELKARWIKATKEDGALDLAKCAWQIWDGDKLILNATVADITGGRAETLYSAVATESFAKDLMGKIRAHGAEKVATMFKASQAASLPPPAPMGDAPQVPAMPGDADSGKDGDPKATVKELLEKARDVISDALEAENAVSGDQAEMGDMPELAAVDDSSTSTDSSKVSTAILNGMRKDIGAGLKASLNEIVTELKDYEADLSTVEAMYDGGLVSDGNRNFIKSVAEDACVNTKKALAKAEELLAATAIFARGTEKVVKRAEAEKQNGVNMSEGTDLMSLIGDTNKDIEAVAQTMTEADSLHAMLADDLANLDAGDVLDASAAEDLDLNDVIMTSDPAKAAELAKKDPTLPVELKAASTKEARAEARAKIASEMKWNPVFYDFHPKGGATTQMDTKPEGNLGVVENLEERHDQMMDVATAPPKVRKEAAEIQRLVSEGRLDPAKDLDVLVANGVDPEAVKYWKQFYGEMGPEGSQFATELVKEHAKAEAEKEMSLYRVKIARAYEAAYDMVDRELLARDHTAIGKQVDDFMKMNDAGFESFKKVIARHSPALDKRAARIPQVGLYESVESLSSAAEKEDLATQLANAFSKSSKRMF